MNWKCYEFNLKKNEIFAIWSSHNEIVICDDKSPPPAAILQTKIISRTDYDNYIVNQFNYYLNSVDCISHNFYKNFSLFKKREQ